MRSRIRALFARLWACDVGGIVTTEYVMVMGIAAGGAVSAGVAMRDSVAAGFRRLGDNITATAPDPERTRRLIAQPEPPPVTTAAAASPVSYTFVPPAP